MDEDTRANQLQQSPLRAEWGHHLPPHGRESVALQGGRVGGRGRGRDERKGKREGGMDGREGGREEGRKIA